MYSEKNNAITVPNKGKNHGGEKKRKLKKSGGANHCQQVKGSTV
jgi:hypothetical protein